MAQNKRRPVTFVICVTGSIPENADSDFIASNLCLTARDAIVRQTGVDFRVHDAAARIDEESENG